MGDVAHKPLGEYRSVVSPQDAPPPGDAATPQTAPPGPSAPRTGHRPETKQERDTRRARYLVKNNEHALTTARNPRTLRRYEAEQRERYGRH